MLLDGMEKKLECKWEIITFKGKHFGITFLF